ncbi:hypothetical protein [Phenylobacterium sp.]|uniref:hypothetical protein n=1 Tax=Phenylobacterium sp. TaxID=1871053 RepID=UPI0027354BFE|nr:hypothetical protein [Phenylobacterium sp.]
MNYRQKSFAAFGQRLIAGAFGVIALSAGVLAFSTEPRKIVGKPVEVRSTSRTVFMPDGRRFAYRCWAGRGRGICPAEAKWNELPRWPEPHQVEMEVAGRRIMSLKMDGSTIVDAAEFKTQESVYGALSISFGLLALWVGAPALVQVASFIPTYRRREQPLPRFVRRSRPVARVSEPRGQSDKP